MPDFPGNDPLNSDLVPVKGKQLTTEEISTLKHGFLKEHILPSYFVVSFRCPEATIKLYACWANVPVVSWSDLSIPTVRTYASPLL